MKKTIIQLVLYFIVLLMSNNCSCLEKQQSPTKDIQSGTIQEPTTIQISPHITLYFTAPCRENTLADALIELIKKQGVNATLDLCIYGLDHEGIISALIEAIEQGVQVRFVGNQDGNTSLSGKRGQYYASYYRIAEALDQAFPRETKRVDYMPGVSVFQDFALINNRGIMHHKFMLITTDTGEEYLVTGSTNLTQSGLTMNDNNTLVIQDRGITGTYRTQFKYLLGLPGADRIVTVKRHMIDEIKIEVVFSGQDKEGTSQGSRLVDGMMPMEHVSKKIEMVSNSIYFMIFSFTHADLHNQLIDKKNRNIEIQGIFDASQAYYSREETMVQQGIACRLDGNTCTNGIHGGKLHNKVMILDPGQETAMVITGSFNWSKNSNEANNEDLLFIQSKKLAEEYKRKWDTIWEMAHDVKAIPIGDSAQYQDIVINEVMWMGSTKNDGTIQSTDEFIELKNMTGKTLNLSGWTIDGAGRGGIPILLDTMIGPSAYQVITKRAQEESAFQPETITQTPDLAIANTSIQLVLRDINGTEIDYAGNGSDGASFAGYSESGVPLKKSMARKENPGDGRIVNSWTNTTTQGNISPGYVLYTLATPGLSNTTGKKPYKELDVVFSKIAWAGTVTSAYDEWLELHNNTEKDINLAGWTISWKDQETVINLYGIIPAKSTFLLERTDDDAIPGLAADLIYSGNLGNSGEVLKLVYATTDIDVIDRQAGWIHGSAISNDRAYMQRINLTENGEEANWKTGPCDYKYATNSKGRTKTNCSYCEECKNEHNSTLRVVFSEIAWAGTSNSAYDEWIELYNNTDTEIDMSQLKIAYGDATFRLSGSLPPNKHYLIERSDDGSVPEKTADFIHTVTRLQDTGERLVLLYNGDVIIDECNWSAGWPAGISTPVASRLSMERLDMLSACNNAANWQNGIGDTEGADNANSP